VGKAGQDTEDDASEVSLPIRLGCTLSRILWAVAIPRGHLGWGLPDN
jgi:hypothetical protein